MDYVFEVAMMSDLISRLWMMEQLDSLGDTRLIKRNFIALVTNAPTVDSVEVVRCRECVGRPFWEEDHNGVPVCLLSGLYVRSDDDFCPYGERKDGDWNG